MISRIDTGTLRLRLPIYTVVFLVFLGCNDLIVNEIDNTNNVEVFESAWSIVHNVYPFLEFKQIDWDSLHIYYNHRAQDARGDKILDVLAEMLNELRDGHVSLLLRPGLPGQYFKTPRGKRDYVLFDPTIVRKYSDRELMLSTDKNMEYGLLSGNIGYIRLTTFTLGPWVSEFESAMDYLRNSVGLIVDVRHNTGGTDLTADKVIGQFISSPLPRPPLYIKGEAKPLLPIQPAGTAHFSKTVVVLLNGVSFSMTEYFVEAMKQLPSVISVGDTTGGGGGVPEFFYLPNGCRMEIPRNEIRRYDGVRIEWNGVVPDETIMNSEAEIRQGRDRQLEKALELLR